MDFRCEIFLSCRSYGARLFVVIGFYKHVARNGALVPRPRCGVEVAPEAKVSCQLRSVKLSSESREKEKLGFQNRTAFYPMQPSEEFFDAQAAVFHLAAIGFEANRVGRRDLLEG
jgi:hypothetical protein